MIRNRRGGFTLIEILVVIGIILVLIAIGVIGYQHIDKVASERATKTNLDTCTSILSEYELTAGSLSLIEGPNSVVGYGFANPPVATTNPLSPTPGDVNSGSPDRYSQKDPAPGNPPPPAGGPNFFAVYNTAVILQTMARVPSVAAILAKMPPAALLPSNNMQSGGPGAWLDDDPNKPPFVMNPQVTIKQPTTGPLPVVMDAWQNPIIYIPSGGMSVMVGGKTLIVTSVDGRPFWASAGQDGNFLQGDDNVYSATVRYH